MLKPKAVYYRNYKKFNEANFLKDIKNCDFKLRTDDPNENYDFFNQSFKRSFIRINQFPFMNKNLGNKFTPEVDLEINFVKTLIKKWNTE